MINFGEISSGSSIGLPFNIMGKQVSSVSLTLGHYDPNGDFQVEVGPYADWSFTNSDDYTIVYVDSVYNTVSSSEEKYVFIKVLTLDNSIFIIEGKYLVALLPFEESNGGNSDEEP